ncbi:hypothetical protein D3C74_485850 [compost metagenome]
MLVIDGENGIEMILLLTWRLIFSGVFFSESGRHIRVLFSHTVAGSIPATVLEWINELR